MTPSLIEGLEPVTTGDAGRTIITCAQCGKLALRRTGEVNRARSAGLRLFCDRACSAVGRRTDTRTRAEKAAAKRQYDIEYRANNRAVLKAKKAEYFQRTYDPAKAAIERQKIMPRHIEYCRRPEYREWKRKYDRQYRAENEYGEFAECFLLIMDIRNECLSQMTDYEIRYAKGGIAKTQQRKRAYVRSLREELEVGPLGNLELGQGWQNGSLASGLRRIPSSRNSPHDEHATAGFSASEAAGVGGRHHVRRDVDRAALTSSKGSAQP